MDHCFPTKDGSDVSVAVLALKDRTSRATRARPILRKGRLQQDTVDQAASSTHRMGRRGKVLLKTDDEPAS
eukprot:7558693-Alexandrium_andersonii.AAC.1